MHIPNTRMSFRYVCGGAIGINFILFLFRIDGFVSAAHMGDFCAYHTESGSSLYVFTLLIEASFRIFRLVGSKELYNSVFDSCMVVVRIQSLGSGAGAQTDLHPPSKATGVWDA